jgi:hypothetical protein
LALRVELRSKVMLAGEMAEAGATVVEEEMVGER